MSIVLMYHSISWKPKHALQVSPSELCNHLSWLEEIGFRWGSLADVVGSPESALAAITFDDGFQDNLEMLHSLSKHVGEITLFVCPGMTGQTNTWAKDPDFHLPLLSRRDLKLLPESVNIGCHSWEHRPVLEQTLSDLRTDIERCLDWFSCLPVERPYTYAYPFGVLDPARAEVVGEYFRLSASVDPCPEVPLHLAIPRLSAVHGVSRDWFLAEVERRSLSHWSHDL